MELWCHGVTRLLVSMSVATVLEGAPHSGQELVPVDIDIALWGAQWQVSTVIIQSDNAAVVAAFASGLAKDTTLMHLLHCLHSFLAHYDVHVVARHLPGRENTAADALSRNNLPVFFRCHLQANPTPSSLPQALRELLVFQTPDWLSPTWRKLFLAILHKP